jgi:hypothetical protein
MPNITSFPQADQYNPRGGGGVSNIGYETVNSELFRTWYSQRAAPEPKALCIKGHVYWRQLVSGDTYKEMPA